MPVCPTTEMCPGLSQGVGVCDVDDLMNECATPKQLDFDRVCFRPDATRADYLANTQAPNSRCLQEVRRARQQGADTAALHL